MHLVSPQAAQVSSVLTELIESIFTHVSGGGHNVTIFILDLIIGAYNSNSVIMLRARPIISVSTFLEEAGLHGIDPGKAGCDLDPNSDHACFNFRACFQVDSEEINVEMKIRFTIVAEPKKAVSRVWLQLAEFAGNEDSKSSVVEHMLVIQVGNR